MTSKFTRRRKLNGRQPEMKGKAVRKRVFVIYGRDVEAHAELAKFLHALNLEEIRFEDVANSLGPSPFVADAVLRGIYDADAVIALVTPDEHAALYDPGRPLEPMLVDLVGKRAQT